MFESMAAGKQTVLNAIKTNAVVMGSRPKLEQMISDEVTEQPCFFINGTQIGTGKNTKCLGFQLDSSRCLGLAYKIFENKCLVP